MRPLALAVLPLALVLGAAPALAEDRPPEKDGEDGFFYRYRPTPMSFEAGVYFGMAWFSRDHNLQDLAQTTLHRSYQQINSSPSVGARIGFFPLAFLGAEAEGGAVFGHTPDTQTANIWTVRGAVVVQAPVAHVVPFAYGGAGIMAIDSEPLGKDSDPVTYFGAGLKLAVSPYVSFRIDVRDNLMQKNRLLPGVQDGDLEHNGELLGGALFTLGRTTVAEPASARADQDKDGVPDELDSCPTEPGPGPTGCPPPKDTDGDDVPDPEDRCPDVKGVAPDGCPPKDGDGDGIPDVDDACPTEKGLAPDGCPAPAPEPVLDPELQ